MAGRPELFGLEVEENVNSGQPKQVPHWAVTVFLWLLCALWLWRIGL